MIQRTLSLLTLSILVLSSSFVLGADEKPPIFTDPAKAGADYAIQGEYLGDLKISDSEVPLGVQIIAQGDGKFNLVAHLGGLPGDGWLRGGERAYGDGKLIDGVATIRGDSWLVKIKDGLLTVTDSGGAEIGQMKKITRKSPTLGAKPPKDALVLFDGSSADAFQRGKIVMDKLLLADCETKNKFGDHSFHLEFRTPFKPHARGQARGNSGVYLQSRYELQVLDSFGLSGKNNECGGIYSISEPEVNMCFPPLTWQTYDVDFTAALYDKDGKKTKNARATIRHNGVVIHDDLELTNGTPGKLSEGPEKAGLYLQGHGNPVVYRNIWFVEKN